MTLPTVVRRWAYIGALVGAGVSIAANVLHSYVPPDNLPPSWQPATGAVVGAIFWPVALLIVIELFARWHPDVMRFRLLRWLGLVPVAVVAAVVSYRHMSGLLEWWHEDPVTVVIGPLAVDGIMVMAAGALIATSPAEQQPTPTVEVPADDDPVAEVEVEPVTADEVAPPMAVRMREAEQEKLQVTLPVGLPPVVRPRPAVPPPPTADGNGTPEVIRTLRVENPDATQKRVAELAGMSVRTVARYWQVTAPSMNGGMTHDP